MQDAVHELKEIEQTAGAECPVDGWSALPFAELFTVDVRMGRVVATACTVRFED